MNTIDEIIERRHRRLVFLKAKRDYIIKQIKDEESELRYFLGKKSNKNQLACLFVSWSIGSLLL